MTAARVPAHGWALLCLCGSALFAVLPACSLEQSVLTGYRGFCRTSPSAALCPGRAAVQDGGFFTGLARNALGKACLPPYTYASVTTQKRLRFDIRNGCRKVAPGSKYFQCRMFPPSGLGLALLQATPGKRGRGRPHKHL